jgi:hypothetical protein
VHSTPVRVPGGPADHARFTFLDDRSRDFWIDWARAADDAVAQLRTAAGRDPYDRALGDLVGELSTRSAEFRTRWAAHDVRLHQTGAKHVRHPVVGELHLDYEAMELPGQPGLLLIAFTTPAGTPDADAIRLLSSWAATHTPDHRSAQPSTAIDEVWAAGCAGADDHAGRSCGQGPTERAVSRCSAR